MTQVRLEKPSDYRRSEELARLAFWNLYVPGTDLHYVVNQMREHADYIHELALVIEHEGELQGAVYFTRAQIINSNGESMPIIAMGPLFINPSYHRIGLGRQLLGQALDKARDLGYPAVLTMGYPYHYEPHGFRGAKQYGISLPDGEYYMGLQALELVPDALAGHAGAAHFSPALEVDAEQAELFDKSFPPLQKQWQESQQEFEVACALRDKR